MESQSDYNRRAAERVGGAILAALIIFVVGVQVGIAHARVTLTAAPCVELKTDLCLVDQHGREVRVLGDGSVHYYTPAPNVTNTKWEVGR